MNTESQKRHWTDGIKNPINQAAWVGGGKSHGWANGKASFLLRPRSASELRKAGQMKGDEWESRRNLDRQQQAAVYKSVHGKYPDGFTPPNEWVSKPYIATESREDSMAKHAYVDAKKDWYRGNPGEQFSMSLDNFRSQWLNSDKGKEAVTPWRDKQQKISEERNKEADLRARYPKTDFGEERQYPGDMMVDTGMIPNKTQSTPQLNMLNDTLGETKDEYSPSFRGWIDRYFGK